jgi:hypothetical protein
MLADNKIEPLVNTNQATNLARIKKLLISIGDHIMKKAFDNKSFNKIDIQNINYFKH